MGCMLRLGRWWMIELFDGVFNISRQVEFDTSFGIIPLEVNSTEDIALPFGDCCILFSTVGDEVNGVLAVDVLYAKIYGHKTECEGVFVCLNRPDARPAGM